MVFTKKVNIKFQKSVHFLFTQDIQIKSKEKQQKNKETACKNALFLQAVYYLNIKSNSYSGGLVVSPGTGSGSGSGVTVVSGSL